MKIHGWMVGAALVLGGCDGAAEKAKTDGAKAGDGAPTKATPAVEAPDAKAAPKPPAAGAGEGGAVEVPEGEPDPEGVDACEPGPLDDDPGPGSDLKSFEDGEMFGFKDVAGKVVIEPRFAMEFGFTAQGLGGVADDDGFAFIDMSGKVIARAFAYDNGPDPFVAGRARIIEGDKVGFIDEAGTIVVPPTYDGAGPFCKGLAPVCSGCKRVPSGEHFHLEGGKWGFIDRSGAVVVPLEHEAANTDNDTPQVVDGGKTQPVDGSGVVAEPPAGAAKP